MDTQAAVDTREEQEQVIELGEASEETRGGPWGAAFEFTGRAYM